MNPLLHYLRHGASEGRRPRDDTADQARTDERDLIASSGLFDSEWYLDRNPDARAAGIDPVLVPTVVRSLGSSITGDQRLSRSSSRALTRARRPASATTFRWR